MLYDDIFENSINRIFSNKMNLNSFVYFPIIQIYSPKKGKNASWISYLQIKIQEKEKEKVEAKEFCYLSKKNIYISFNIYLFQLKFKSLTYIN